MDLSSYEQYEYQLGASGARAAFRAMYSTYPRTVKPIFFEDGCIYVAGPIPGSEETTADKGKVKASQEVLW